MSIMSGMVKVNDADDNVDAATCTVVAIAVFAAVAADDGGRDRTFFAWQ